MRSRRSVPWREINRKRSLILFQRTPTYKRFNIPISSQWPLKSLKERKAEIHPHATFKHSNTWQHNMLLSLVGTSVTGMKKEMPNSLKLVSLEERNTQQVEVDYSRIILRQTWILLILLWWIAKISWLVGMWSITTSTSSITSWACLKTKRDKLIIAPRDHLTIGAKTMANNSLQAKTPTNKSRIQHEVIQLK